MLKDKSSTFIDSSVKIGDNVIIYENNRIEGASIIEDNVTIYPNSFIVDSKIGKGSKIYSSVIEKASMGCCCIVGPFSHLKKGTNLSSHVSIGDFCEIKSSEISSYSKISRLCYLENAIVGDNCTVFSGAKLGGAFNNDKKLKIESGTIINSDVKVLSPKEILKADILPAGAVIE